MRFACALAAPIALACSPAVAQRDLASTTVTTVETGSFGQNGALFHPLRQGGGLLEFTIEFSKPVNVVDFYSYYLFAYDYDVGYANDYNRVTGEFAVSNRTDLKFTTASFSTFSLNGQSGRSFGMVSGSPYNDSFSYRYFEGVLFGYFENTDGASYILTTNFTPFVPEPGTWALMILGFGAIGYAMRSRRKVSVRYA